MWIGIFITNVFEKTNNKSMSVWNEIMLIWLNKKMSQICNLFNKECLGEDLAF